MRKEYDFSKAKKNPYASLLKKQVTIRLDEGTVKYFKELAADAGIPYQTLINLYLRDCAASGRKLSMEWKSFINPEASFHAASYRAVPFLCAS